MGFRMRTMHLRNSTGMARDLNNRQLSEKGLSCPRQLNSSIIWLKTSELRSSKL